MPGNIFKGKSKEKILFLKDTFFQKIIFSKIIFLKILFLRKYFLSVKNRRILRV